MGGGADDDGPARRMVCIKALVPAATNDVNTRFILLDKGVPTTEGPERTCVALIADETAAVHFQFWGGECDAFEKGDIIQLTNGIFSFHKGKLLLRAGKRGMIEKIGEFTMLFVETPNLSEIMWSPDPVDATRYVQGVVYSPSPSPGGVRLRSRQRSRSGSRSGYRSRSRSRSRSFDREGSDAVNPGNTLYVTGLSSRVSERDLEAHFSREGKVISCRLVVEPHTRISRGFAFVTMDKVQEADRCVKYLNRSILEGRYITVEKSRRQRPRTPTPGHYLGAKNNYRNDRGRARGGYDRDHYRNEFRRSPRDSPYRRGHDYSPRGHDYSPRRSPHAGRSRRERSRSLPYSPYGSPDRDYGRRYGG